MTPCRASLILDCVCRDVPDEPLAGIEITYTAQQQQVLHAHVALCKHCTVSADQTQSLNSLCCRGF